MFYTVSNEPLYERTTLTKLDLNNLKTEFERNPSAVMAAAGLLATGLAKLTKTVIDGRNARTWKKEVDRRVKNSRR
jgi:hypothetical protein